MIRKLRHISRRRAALRSALDMRGAFDQWKESCVPSYLHPNPAAALVSWLRLFEAAAMAREETGPGSRILDFGASVGELYHLLPEGVRYHFVEQDPHAAAVLQTHVPGAVQIELADATSGAFDAVFAIDSLEHNVDFPALVAELSEKVAPGGVLVLSGPTENALYRLGRRIAGFEGDYHVTTIYRIEEAVARHLRRDCLRTVPLGLPLFRLSSWRLP